MHRCLKVPEIVHIICGALDPNSYPNPWSFSTRDLAILARTCTSFCGPALHHLWARTTLSRILLRCMPSDLWAQDVLNDPGMFPNDTHEIRLLRIIRASDWARVKFYGRWVKDLSCGADLRSLSNVFPALSVSLLDGLFPNLQALSWHHSKDDFHYIHLFLCRTVIKISLTVSSDANSSLFSTLATKCPNLMDVYVATAGHGNPEPAVSEFVCNLQGVQKLEVPSLDQRALEHISRLTTLDELTLSSLPEVLTRTSSRHSFAFSNLRHLMFNSPKIGPTTRFLQWCSGVPLVEFSAFLWDLPTRSELQSFLAAISAAFLHSTLTQLSVECECDDLEGSDVSIHLISLQTLRHIFGFVNLTQLVIISPVGFDLDNDAVEELAQAWPRIVTLRLTVCVPGHPPRATLSCLHSFAQHCPHLCRLTFALDALVVPSPEVDPRTRFIQHAMTTIHVEHSPLADPFYAARFLSGVFPKLTYLLTQREDYANDEEEELEHGDAIRLHRLWKRAEWLLPELSALRDEGRMLAQAASTS
ncbi:hypothetical protein C8R45DRAFT_854276 [Mycena sanguinolenta]|nr:hypothetical protein C8R45DRAFT_854276 [Mycena sanguinolenta]